MNLIDDLVFDYIFNYIFDQFVKFFFKKQFEPNSGRGNNMILKHKYSYLNIRVSPAGVKIAVDMPSQFSYIRPPGSES